MKRDAWFSRRVVDPVNSVVWYAMDGLWLAQLAWPAYVATGLTLATGGMLLLLNRRRGRRLNDDLALNAWMWMNALWLVSDLGKYQPLRHAALAFGGVGAVLLLTAIRPARRERTTLRRFRKVRTLAR
jgi:nitrate reductase gamma subunit